MTLLTMIMKMSEGLGKTCAIFFLTILFSLPLGMLITLLRMSKNKVVSSVTRFVIAVLRGTPLMLQLLAVTYGPYYLFGTAVAKNKLIPVVIAFAINYAAYFAEIYRGGIESIPVGQYEAANVLGYTRAQTFLRIILPQVVKRIMPSITNEVVTLVKDTSMAFTVSYQEMFTIGKQIANSQTSFMPFLVAGVFYFVFNAIVDFVIPAAVGVDIGCGMAAVKLNLERNELTEKQLVAAFQAILRNDSAIVNDERSKRDSLTKLYNHESFYEELEYYQRRYEENRERFSLAVIDIDNFKRINDTFGHTVGDTVITDIAGVLQSQFQETDVTARVGGDEFLALMRDVAPKEAEACAAALGREARKKLIGDDAIVEVTLSIGMAVYGEDGRDYETLFAMADRAMYATKREGKDHYSFAGKKQQERWKQ